MALTLALALALGVVSLLTSLGPKHVRLARGIEHVILMELSVKFINVQILLFGVSCHVIYRRWLELSQYV